MDREIEFETKAVEFAVVKYEKWPGPFASRGKVNLTFVNLEVNVEFFQLCNGD